MHGDGSFGAGSGGAAPIPGFSLRASSSTAGVSVVTGVRTIAEWVLARPRGKSCSGLPRTSSPADPGMGVFPAGGPRPLGQRRQSDGSGASSERWSRGGAPRPRFRVSGRKWTVERMSAPTGFLRSDRDAVLLATGGAWRVRCLTGEDRVQIGLSACHRAARDSRISSPAHPAGRTS